MEQAREAKIYGVRPSRSFRQACEKFIKESLHLRTIRDIAARLEYVCEFIGKMELQKVNRGSLQVVIDAKHDVSSRTKNAYLEDVRRVLNRAAADWIDENGLTWLHAAPKIKLLPKNDAKQPTPISHEEQTRLLAELPAHLQPMVLFAIHTGAREAEICNLKWEWFNSEHGLFLIPSSFTKMNRDRIIVCNSVALSVIGKRGNGLVYGTNKKINNTAWQSARKRAGVECRVHDLRHTFASRLRANNIPPHTIAELLGHKSGNITLHYSAAQLDELKTAVETLVYSRPGIILRRVK